MYVSRVILDTHRTETVQALSQPQRLHGAVERSFEGRESRKLWRIDWLGGRCCLLIVSSAPPVLSGLLTQFGAVDGTPDGQTKRYSVLERLTEGQRWHFRLCANPVHSVHRPEEPSHVRGKVYAHVTPEQQKRWLLDRASTYGFALSYDDFDIVHERRLSFVKGAARDSRVTVVAVDFEGVLTVADKGLFADAMTKGIGRAKAYGCGLLTIARGSGDA